MLGRVLVITVKLVTIFHCVRGITDHAQAGVRALDGRHLLMTFFFGLANTKPRYHMITFSKFFCSGHSR